MCRRKCVFWRFCAEMAPFSRAGGYNYSFCAEKDTSFRRRRVPRSNPGGFGGQFRRRMVPRGVPGGFGNEIPRRRLQFFFLRRKRYPIPARKGATECSRQICRPIPAQNFICGQSARVRRAIPAQATTFFRYRRIWQPIPAQNVTTEVFQAEMAPFSRAGNKKKLTQKASFTVYFLKYVLLLNLLIIADQNLHQKSFSHQNPLYIPFLLQGICP